MYNEEFASRILDEIKEQFPNMKVQLKDVQKNNNIILHGLIIGSDKNRDVAPTIYIDKYMKDEEDAVYEQEYLEDVIADIQEQYEAGQKEVAYIQSIMDSLLDFDMMKEKIYFSLVNYDKNKDFLMKIPHRKFLDLAITYRMLIKSTKNGEVINSIVSNDVLERWGDITEEELYNLAMENTPKLFEFESQKITDLLSKFMNNEEKKAVENEIEKENMLLVVSNKNKNKGSYVMLYQNYLREVIKQYGFSRAYILPSSIHEVLLLLEDPKKGLVNVLDILDMVKTVNMNEVDEHEILADSVYEISLTDDIAIAASSRPWKGWEEYYNNQFMN